MNQDTAPQSRRKLCVSQGLYSVSISQRDCSSSSVQMNSLTKIWQNMIFFWFAGSWKKNIFKSNDTFNLTQNQNLLIFGLLNLFLKKRKFWNKVILNPHIEMFCFENVTMKRYRGLGIFFLFFPTQTVLENLIHLWNVSVDLNSHFSLSILHKWPKNVTQL